MNENENILDKFDDQQNLPKESKFWQILPALLFIVGFGLNVLHVRGALLIMIGSLVFASVRLSVRFFRKPRKIFEWAYFLGNIGLMIVVCLSILGIVFLNMITLAPSMVLFIIGILTAGLQRSDSE